MPSQRNKHLYWAAPLAFLLIAGGSAFAERRYEQADLRRKAEAITGGNAERGRRLIVSYGCGGCHSAKGVPMARGLVGPPLDGVGSRAIIAGRLENKPDNLKRWIMDPQAVSPGTAMPDLNVGERDARDISAFLYTRS